MMAIFLRQRQGGPMKRTKKDRGEGKLRKSEGSVKRAKNV